MFSDQCKYWSFHINTHPLRLGSSKKHIGIWYIMTAYPQASLLCRRLRYSSIQFNRIKKSSKTKEANFMVCHCKTSTSRIHSLFIHARPSRVLGWLYVKANNCIMFVPLWPTSPMQRAHWESWPHMDKRIRSCILICRKMRPSDCAGKSQSTYIHAYGRVRCAKLDWLCSFHCTSESLVWLRRRRRVEWVGATVKTVCWRRRRLKAFT